MTSTLTSSSSIAILRKATREKEFAKTPGDFYRRKGCRGGSPKSLTQQPCDPVELEERCDEVRMAREYRKRN